MPANRWFMRELRTTLNSLYDPVALRASPLAKTFDPDRRSDPVSMLQRTLLDGIESLQPTRDTPQGSRAWRVYQILRRRFSEGLSQRQVAGDLGLSIRQLQREEKVAREMLADHLWSVHNLEERSPDSVDVEPDEVRETPEEKAAQSVQEELEWLRSSSPVQLTDVEELIREVLETLEPLMGIPQTTSLLALEGTRRVPLRAAIVRQALLDVLSVAVRFAQDGQLIVRAEAAAGRISIRVTVFGRRVGQWSEATHAESLAMAAQLIRLCDGSLQIDVRLDDIAEAEEKEEPVFIATIVLPAPEQKLVLIVDDNADALQLIERYLSNTRYLFAGAQDAARAVELAAELGPTVILLDVMLPERDGWTLLGQLREHPQTEHIPVIVCTILSQRELALALGAAGFIRKPIKRAELLAMLDRLAGSPRDVPPP